MSLRWSSFALLLPLVLVGCATPEIVGCTPANGLTPDCRFENPEDLASSPAGTALIVSEMGRGSIDSRRGRLLSYVPLAERALPGQSQGEIRVLWPVTLAATAASAATATTAKTAAASLGDSACPALPPGELAPHGIDLARLEDGRHVLYVVNHAVRESIEIFEVDDDGREVALRYAGCVLAPPEATFNDVVGLRDGGFRVSTSFPASDNLIIAGLRMRYGNYRPGFVWQWRPAQGYSRMAGSDVAYANGIEQSADERFVYLNGYFDDAVVKIDAERGVRIAAARIKGPDNLTWSPEGRLLVASQHASTLELLKCLRLEQGSCAMRFEIVELDPQSLEQRTLIDQQGPPFGAATVALAFKGRLYLGTFAGDRLVWR